MNKFSEVNFLDINENEEYVPTGKAEILYGRMFESVGCSPFNSGLFEAMKKTGAQGIFCGHDHINDFHINIDGIDIYQTLGAGYFTYGKERGGRLIILDENNPKKIITQSIEIERITTENI